ncbi:MAG: hypothetical protein K9G62_04200 [Alphaproteobacteria bacterium]|nr:hypothetical protein [Alphaproteobacteria bacterium]
MIHQKINDETRKQITKFLPQAIEMAIDSYRVFSKKGVEKEGKDFKAHHEACKVAIAHLELLLKLAQWLDFPGPGDGISQATLAAMLESAQQEMSEHREGGIL